MKVKSSKGFTLAELLIVMAIIVVLAAVAIPTFGRQLETSRETSDMENIRNAYTDALSIAILDAADGKLDGKKGTIDLTGSGNTWADVTFTAGTENVDGTYQMPISPITSSGDWQYVNNTIANKLVQKPAAKGNEHANFKFKLDGGLLVLDDLVAATTGTPPTPAYGVTIVA